MGKITGSILFFITYYIGYALIYLGLITPLSALGVLSFILGLGWCFGSGMIIGKSGIGTAHYVIMLVISMATASMFIPNLLK